MEEDDPISREWLDRVCAHDESSSRNLVERLYPLVLRIVRAHRPQRMAEEDLCQEVFMRLFASLDQYRGTVPFPHWVSRVAVNTCIDQLRRQRSRPELRWADLAPNEAHALEARQASDGAPHVGHVLARSELLGKLLDALSPADRLVVQWMELEGRSVKEVSALTGWSGALVKIRAFRARHKLRKALKRILAQEPS